MATWDDGMAPDIGNVSIIDSPNIYFGDIELLLFPEASDVYEGTYLGDVELLLFPEASDVYEGTYLGDVELLLFPEAIVPDPAIYFGDIELALLPEASDVYEGTYLGDVELLLFPEAISKTHTKDKGNIEFLLFPEAISFTNNQYFGDIELSLFPEASTITNCGLPYLVRAYCRIDGTDYSNDLFGTVNVSMSDGSATQFSFTLYSTNIPSDFVDKDVEIGFQAADENGIIINGVVLMKGRIRESGINVDSPTLIEVSGYDYGGYHNELGQLYSGNVTSVLTGTIGITSAGALNTGKSPIFNVAYIETAITDVQDGKDYYVDALNGVIHIPISSKLLTAPASLQFQYADPYASFDDLAQGIATLKGWTITNDGFLVSDYTEPKKQPIITLSNESIIDILKKLYEVGGGKLDTSLYPEMRIFSEKIKYEGETQRTFAEEDIIFNSLQMNCSLFDVLTNQTVKSVQNTYSDVKTSASEEIENQSGQVLLEWLGIYFWFTWSNETAQYNNALQTLAALPEKDIVTISVPLAGLGDYSYVPGGTPQVYNSHWASYNYVLSFFLQWTLDQYTDVSSQGIWRSIINYSSQTIDFILSRKPIILRRALFHPPSYPEAYLGTFVVMYPQVDWTLVVSSTSLSYGEGVATTQVEVSGTQAVQKIDIKLEGDVYEQPFIETQAQGENLCKAILHDKRFIYESSADLPIHKARVLKIGDKIAIISRGKNVIGNLKSIAYNIETDSGAGIVNINVKGLGDGI